MKELLMALMLWIGANTNYNTDFPLPEVFRMDKAPLEYQYFKGKIPKDSDVHGFYSLKDKKIYIRGGWPVPYETGVSISGAPKNIMENFFEEFSNVYQNLLSQ